MELSNEFWIGTALAILLSVIASLLAAKAQSLIDRRSEKVSVKRAKQLKDELEEISKYVKDSSLFYVYLLEAGIQIAFYGALFGLFSGVLFVASSVASSSSLWMVVNTLNAMAQFVALIGTLIVFSISRRAISTVSKYRNYENYKSEISELVN